MSTSDPPTITRVIYRVYRGKDGGDVVAILPDVPANTPHVTVYQHLGQHGEAPYWAVMGATRPATPEEYAPLHRELTGIGYRLIVRKRRPIRLTQRQRYKA